MTGLNRKKGRTPIALALAVAAVALLAGPSLAQSGNGRVLRGLEIQPLRDGRAGHVIRLRTAIPIRYLRHTPTGSTDRVDVQFTPLVQDPEILLARAGRETLRPPEGAPVPLREVRYERAERGEGRLELWFTRRVEIEIGPGEDLRSLSVVVLDLAPPERRQTPVATATAEASPPDDRVLPANESQAVTEPPRPASSTEPPPPAAPLAAGAFALQVHAAPADAPLPAFPFALEPGLRLYTVPFTRDGTPWTRVRVGFFASATDARAWRDEQESIDATAWVVEAGPGERALAEGAPADRAVAGTGAMARDRATPPAPETAGTDLSGPPTSKPASAPRETTPLSPEQAELSATWMEQGRAALADGELDRAVQLFTKLLALPAHDNSPDALEWLGVARERKGQEAHARAEYEAYLERYPEGTGAIRVRQRLDALLTARSEPESPLREASEREPERRSFDMFGSLSTYYLRDERFTDDAGDFLNSSMATDVFSAFRGERAGYDVRGEFSGTHVHDFEDDDGDWRVDTLFVEALGQSQPWGLGFGRLPGNRSGVIGRFDGGRLSYRMTPHSQISVVGGLPVEPFVTSNIDFDQQLVGLSFEALEWVPGLDVEAFAIQQWAEGLTDRTAIGSEFSYAGEGYFLAGQVDFDLHFMDLNTAFLIGNWQATRDTNLNLLLDWRKLPFLSTRNALFGQLEDDLDDLRVRFGSGELEDLADDRTAESRSATLGMTHRLNEQFQLAMDVGISDLSGTPASGGIDEFEGTGRQYSTQTQLIGTSLLRDGDVGSLALRYVDARDIDLAGIFASWRSPAWRSFRFNPLFDLLWRRPDVGDSVFVIRPGMRVDYRIGPITVDLDGRYEWSNGERFPGVEDEEAYTLLFGVRYDY